tara:strand:+ start:3075 stop:4205 length:1131 start_codon:yes stop_codon:yes gene_type:complete
MNPNDNADVENSMMDAESPFFGADESANETDETFDRGDDFSPDTELEEEAPDTSAVSEEVEETTDEEPETPPEEEVAEEESEVEEPESESEPDEETSETVEETPALKESPDSRRSSHIPRSRFDKVNTDLAAAKERIQALEKGTSPAPVKPQADVEAEADQAHNLKITKLLGDANNLILDGQTDEAVQLQQQAFELTQQRASEKAVAQANSDADERVNREVYNVQLGRLETDYPFLNPDAGEGVYDQSMVNRVSALAQGLMGAEGMTQVEALEEAVESVAARFGVTAVSAAAPVEDTEEVAVARETEQALAVRKQKTKTATIKRNTKIAAKQPAKLGGSSAASVERSLPTLSQMSESEFDSVSQQELERLRGDFIG